MSSRMVAAVAPEASESQRRRRRAKRRSRKGGHGMREEVRHAHRHRENKGTLITRKVKKCKSMQMLVRSQPSLREEAWEDSRSKQLLYFEKRVFQMERNFANKLEAARARAAAHDAALREQLRKADATFAATTRHQRWRLRQTREVFETRQAGPDMVIASRNPQMYLDAYNTQAPVVLDLADGRRVSGKVTDMHWHGPEKGGTLHLRGDTLPYARHQAIAYEIETRVESIRAMNEQFRACLQASDSNDCPIDEDDADQRATNALKGVADAELYGRLCKRYSGFPDEFFVQLERPGRAFLRLIHFQAARIANWLRFWYTRRLQQREQLARMLQRLARARGAHRTEEAEKRAHKQAEEENRSRIFVQVFTTWKKATQRSSRLRRAVERMRQRKLARVLRGWQQAISSSAARRRSGIRVLFTMIMHPHFAIWHANAAQRRRQRRAQHFGRRLRARSYLERWIEATVTGLAKRHLYKCKAATEIQRVVRGEWARRTTRAERRAITRIQAWWRGARTRHEYHRYNGLRERLLRYHARRRERAREGRRHRAASHWQAARGGFNE